MNIYIYTYPRMPAAPCVESLTLVPRPFGRGRERNYYRRHRRRFSCVWYCLFSRQQRFRCPYGRSLHCPYGLGREVLENSRSRYLDRKFEERDVAVTRYDGVQMLAF